MFPLASLISVMPSVKMYIELFEKLILVSLNLNLGAMPKGGPASSKLEKFPSLE